MIFYIPVNRRFCFSRALSILLFFGSSSSSSSGLSFGSFATAKATKRTIIPLQNTVSRIYELLGVVPWGPIKALYWTYRSPQGEPKTPLPTSNSWSSPSLRGINTYSEPFVGTNRFFFKSEKWYVYRFLFHVKLFFFNSVLITYIIYFCQNQTMLKSKDRLCFSMSYFLIVQYMYLHQLKSVTIFLAP